VLAIGSSMMACNGCEFYIGWVFSFLFGMGVVAGSVMGFPVGFHEGGFFGVVR
jgi:hypothetical protein